MIRTRIVEARVNTLGKLEETELGWCLMPEVPIEKTVPQAGDPPRTPMAVKVNGENYWIIGHSWDILVISDIDRAVKDSVMYDATLVLVVQKIEAAPSSLVKAGPDVMKQLDAMSGGVVGKKN